MTDSDKHFGQLGIYDVESLFHQIQFLIKQALAEHRTTVPVKILAVHGGGVGKAPTVDVQVMLKQMDMTGVASSHSTVYGIPVARNQGGVNVVINDPVVGDTGHLVVMDRDITSWKNNGGDESNPGSFRRHDLADGVYHHAVCNDKHLPKQYLHFKNKSSSSGGSSISFDIDGGVIVETSGGADGDGIDLIDAYQNKFQMGKDGINKTDTNGNTIFMTKDGVLINGCLITKTGGIKAKDDILSGTKTTMDTHLHTLASGPGNSGPPVLGS